MKPAFLGLSAGLLILVGCAGNTGHQSGHAYYNDPFYDPWDYGFRYGVYYEHEREDWPDRPERPDRPDRPDPPPGLRPDRPDRPPGGFDSPSRPVGGSGKIGGGGRSFGGRR